jgi:hypothetical protein
MAAITRIADEPVRHPTLRDLIRRWAAAAGRVARWLPTRIAGVATAGQLGPVAETEAGRWTGARI